MRKFLVPSDKKAKPQAVQELVKVTEKFNTKRTAASGKAHRKKRAVPQPWLQWTTQKKQKVVEAVICGPALDSKLAVERSCVECLCCNLLLNVASHIVYVLLFPCSKRF
eukprot:EG_transcript_47420